MRPGSLAAILILALALFAAALTKSPGGEGGAVNLPGHSVAVEGTQPDADEAAPEGGGEDDGGSAPSGNFAIPLATAVPALIAQPRPNPIVTFFVDVLGSDLNPGTQILPFRTVTTALFSADLARQANPLVRVQINVRAGMYGLGEFYPLVVNEGVSLESVEGPARTSLVGTGSTPVVVMALGTINSEVRGFDISGGSVGIFAWVNGASPLLRHRGLIENNFIHDNDGRFSSWSAPVQPRYAPAEMGIVHITAGAGRTDLVIRHNSVFHNYDDSEPSRTLGTGIMIEATQDSANMAQVLSNEIYDHEINLLVTSRTFWQDAVTSPYAHSNLIWFAEFNVEIEGRTTPRIMQNTIAFARPSSNVFPPVVWGLRIREFAVPRDIRNNILWTPDIAGWPHAPTTVFQGRDLDLTASFVFSNDIAGFWAMYPGRNVYRNGVWSNGTMFPINPATMVLPATIEFVNGIINWNLVGGGLDLHLVGFRSRSLTDRANVLLIDTADPMTIAPGQPDPLDVIAIDVDADPRMSRYYFDRPATADYGADEVMAVRIAYSDPLVCAPSFHNIIGDYSYLHPAVFIVAQFDPNHPLAYIGTSSVLVVSSAATFNMYLFGMGNLLVDPTGLFFLPGGSPLFVQPITGQPGTIEMGIHLQGAVVNTALGQTYLTNRLGVELNEP